MKIISIISLFFSLLTLGQTPQLLLPLGHSSPIIEDNTFFINEGTQVLSSSNSETIQWNSESGRISGVYEGALLFHNSTTVQILNF